MFKPLGHKAALLATTLALSPALAIPARAQDPDARLTSIERQIQALQAELRQVKQEQAARDREAHAALAKAAQAEAQVSHEAITTTPMPNIPDGYALVRATPGATPGTVVISKVETPEEQEPKLPQGAFRVGNVTVTLGGFIDASYIFRSRNETADIGSNLNTGIPLPNSPNYYQSENRFSARASRFSILTQADPDANTELVAYGEADFQGAAPTSNSNESNSYVPRLRQAFAEYNRSDLGLSFLAGQAWSLLTLDKVGITARKEDPPIGIDTSYIVGFSFARQPQFRVVKSFDNGKFWLAASIESPQTVYFTGPNGLTPVKDETINVNNPGGTGYASTVTYSSDVAPDFQVKAAADFSVAHLEAYGLLRTMHDRASTLGEGSNNNEVAGGGGAGAIVHLIPKYLDIQGSFLAGDGIGRYGAGQLPDATVGANGQPVPLPEVQALLGIIGHPDPAWDLYGYLGTEQITSGSFTADVKGKPEGYGYGSVLYNNTSCNIELGSSSDCVANTHGLVEGSLGFWYRFERGPYGTMQVGSQYEYLHRNIFQGVGPTPHTDDNIVMVSFRYYPFQ